MTQRSRSGTKPIGFVDLQVNGYRGVDFSSPTLELDEIIWVTEALRDAGTIAYCATIITSNPEIYRRNLPIIAAAMDQAGVRDRLLGIHLEGPYLSKVEGARGAHSPERMRRPSANEFDCFQEWASGRIAIITLAPELDGALDLISHVRRNHRTRISLGHHLASREILKRAADAGATLITHLGNGCPNLLPRHDNIIMHQLANDSLKAGLITDGHHLSEDFVRVAFRCKGVDRIFIVSDCAPIAGYGPGIYETLGNPVRLTAAGMIENLHSPHLVGSGCSLAQCMQHLKSLGFLSDEELRKVGFENPLQILGVDPARVRH
jgi:N-acetylglucosamine-6-phosphate deacetylase